MAQYQEDMHNARMRRQTKEQDNMNLLHAKGYTTMQLEQDVLIHNSCVCNPQIHKVVDMRTVVMQAIIISTDNLLPTT